MANYSVNISRDKEPINPRDNPSYDKMLCWHDKYSLGDNHAIKNYRSVLVYFLEQFNLDKGQMEFDAIAVNRPKDYIIAELNKHMAIEPLYLYDGQYPEILTEKEKDGVQGEFIGYSFMTTEAIKKYYNSPLSPETIKSAHDVLKDNIYIYSHYLSGDNYLLEILKDDEVLYAIQGFTGKFDDEMLHDMEMTTEDYLIGEGLEYEDIQEMFDIDIEYIISNKTTEFVPNIEPCSNLEQGSDNTIKDDVFHKSSSFLAMTDNIKHGGGEVISPAPELISEFIMTHKEQTAYITDHNYNVLIEADKGKVISCVDNKFLTDELQPAIDDYDNWVKRWQNLQGNLSASADEDDEDLEL